MYFILVKIFTDHGGDDSADPEFLPRMNGRVFGVRGFQDDVVALFPEVFHRPFTVYLGQNNVAVFWLPGPALR